MNQIIAKVSLGFFGAISCERAYQKLLCLLRGHEWKTEHYDDKSSYAICERCGSRQEPIPRTDGCTPVWEPLNAYKCKHSDNISAKGWGGLCPAHYKSNLVERKATSLAEIDTNY